MTTPKSEERINKRRSTRVSAGVFLDIRGTDGLGKPFLERRVTLEVGFQGCRYFSRYALLKNSWVTLEVSNRKENSKSQGVRARVVWCRRAPQLGGLYQIGVEFERAGNVWDIADPPEDWCVDGAPRAAKPEISKAARADIPTASKDVPFVQELKATLKNAETGTYYQLLGVSKDAPRAQLRQSYYDLVRKFHPDRHMDRPEWMDHLHKIMEAVNISYKTLTDENARKKYDEKITLLDFARSHRENREPRITAEDCLKKAGNALKEQNPAETVIWLRRAVEIDPTSAKYEAMLARALSANAPQRKEAAEHFEKSLQIDPWNASARLQLASLYMEMQLPWRARPHYTKILEIDPDNAKILERLRQIDGKIEKKGAEKRSFVDRILHPTSK